MTPQEKAQANRYALMRMHLDAAAVNARDAENAFRDGTSPAYFLAVMNRHLEWVRNALA